MKCFVEQVDSGMSDVLSAYNDGFVRSVAMDDPRIGTQEEYVRYEEGVISCSFNRSGMLLVRPPDGVVGPTKM